MLTYCLFQYPNQFLDLYRCIYWGFMKLVWSVFFFFPSPFLKFHFPFGCLIIGSDVSSLVYSVCCGGKQNYVIILSTSFLLQQDCRWCSVVDKLEQKNNKMSPYYIRQIVAEFYLLKGNNMFSPGLVVYAIIQINKKD